jgi:hypothetical protein
MAPNRAIAVFWISLGSNSPWNSPNTFPAASRGGLTIGGAAGAIGAGTVGGTTALDGGSVGAVGLKTGAGAKVVGMLGGRLRGNTGGATGGTENGAGTEVAGIFGGVGVHVLAATGCVPGVGFSAGQCVNWWWPLPYRKLKSNKASK